MNSDPMSAQSRSRLQQTPPVDWLLSAATVPLLAGLLAQRALAEGLRELGVLSEELFRGDRLPVLHFPESVPANPEASPTLSDENSTGVDE